MALALKITLLSGTRPLGLDLDGSGCSGRVRVPHPLPLFIIGHMAIAAAVFALNFEGRDRECLTPDVSRTGRQAI